MADLVVELYGVRVGMLVGSDWRTFDFRAERSAFDIFGVGSTVLSFAVPLEPAPTRSRAARRRNYFGELLPEGRMLTRMADQAGLAPYDVIGMLRAYGRDLAGALQIYDPALPGEPREPRVVPVSSSEIGQLLGDPDERPLGNAPVTGKSSLPGVQDKIVLAQVDGAWHQVHDGFPSTHILKPFVVKRPTLIYDEEFTTRLAYRLGLAAAEARLAQFGGVDALVVERFDRSSNVPGGRIQQEDMNQVLGARGDQKYQEIGGVVSLRRIAEVFRAVGDHGSVEALARHVVFAVATGNLDQHAKNLAVLHFPDESLRLAPGYDLVPLHRYGTDGRMAMSVGGEYVHAALTRAHVEDEIRSWGVRNPESVVVEVLETLAGLDENPADGADPRIKADIRRFTGNLLEGRAVAS